jgi:hypothetical protein
MISEKQKWALFFFLVVLNALFGGLTHIQGRPDMYLAGNVLQSGLFGVILVLAIWTK